MPFCILPLIAETFLSDLLVYWKGTLSGILVSSLFQKHVSQYSYWSIMDTAYVDKSFHCVKLNEEDWTVCLILCIYYFRITRKIPKVNRIFKEGKYDEEPWCTLCKYNVLKIIIFILVGFERLFPPPNDQCPWAILQFVATFYRTVCKWTLFNILAFILF